nr:EOG090X0FYC [Simocephalus serrulatus]
MEIFPKRIVCFSGKRKSGKDYVAEMLHDSLPDSVIIRISAPIKKYWSESKGLDMNLLMGDGVYKEKHRSEMIAWGEEKRSQDPGFFCRTAIQMLNGYNFPIWIVSDLRRVSDLEFFRANYPDRVTSVRISASDDTRIQRGFVQTVGVDDAESECGLDHITNWDIVINNDGDASLLQHNLNLLTKICSEALLVKKPV